MELKPKPEWLALTANIVMIGMQRSFKMRTLIILKAYILNVKKEVVAGVIISP